MKGHYILFTFLCILLPFFVISQQVEVLWTTKITNEANILSSNIHFFDGRIGVSITNEDGLQSSLQLLNTLDDLENQVPVPAIDYFEVSHYSSIENCFYFGGSTDAASDSMIFAKTTIDGVTLWRRSLLFSTYAANAIYNISEKGDELLVSFSLFNVSGPTVSSAIGYFVFDRQGNILRQSELLTFPPAPVPIISYTSALDQVGNAVLSVTNFLGPCSIIKFSKSTGLPLWTQDFNLDNNDIQTLLIDEEDNIIFSGYDNKLIKLAADGGILFEKELGTTGFHGGQSILSREGLIYVLGYHYSNDSTNSQAYIGQYDPASGNRNWGWYFDSIPNLFGLGILDGTFADDSTLYVLGSASAEFDFVIKLHLNRVVSNTENVVSNNSFSVYPNPTSSNITCIWTKGKRGIATLNDANGRTIWQQQIDDNEILSLPYKGVFFVHFQNKTSSFVQKIISQ